MSVKLLYDQKLNFISLVVMQGANAFIPLLIFPYLLTKIGPEAFSKLVISETLSIIVLAFVLFGFDITSVNKLANVDSINCTRQTESKIFFSVLYTRLMIFVALIPSAFLVCLIFESSIMYLYLGWILIPLGHIFQSAYFFLYKQTNLVLALSSFTSRIVGSLAVLWFVEGACDLYLIPYLIGIPYLLGGLISFIFAVIHFRLVFQSPSYRNIKNDLNEGFACFVSNTSVLLYRDLNVVILGLLLKDPLAISIYAIAEKLVKGVQAIFKPISQFYLPKALLAINIYNSPSIGVLKIIWKFTYRQLVIFTVFLFFGCVVFIMFYSQISNAIKPSLLEATSICLMMLVVIYFAIPNFMFGMVGLNALNRGTYMAKIVLFTGVVNLGMCYCLVFLLGAYGAAISFVMSELLLFTFIIYLYMMNGKSCRCV